MDFICMKTFIDSLGYFLKIDLIIIGQDNMCGGKTLPLIQAPDVKFMDTKNGRYLFKLLVRL